MLGRGTDLPFLGPWFNSWSGSKLRQFLFIPLFEASVELSSETFYVPLDTF